MMRSAAIICALLAVSAHAMSVTAPSAVVRPRNPQDKYLAKQATGNFACKVNSVKVSTDNPGTNSSVTAESVRAAFQNVATIEWAHALQMSFSPMDGRNDEKVLATPGGDMGEFIQAIAAYAKTAGVTLSQEDVSGMFSKYLKAMTREKFTYETDEFAYFRMANAAGCPGMKIAEVASRVTRSAIVAALADPDSIGDPFIKFLMTDAEKLDFDANLVTMALTAYHETLWTGTTEQQNKLCYLEVKGKSREQALITIKVPPYCIDQGLAPMVSQHMACPAPVYVNHPDVSKLLRREMVAVIGEGATSPSERSFQADFLRTLNIMAENNYQAWYQSVGAGKSSFTVTFSMASKVLEE